MPNWLAARVDSFQGQNTLKKLKICNKSVGSVVLKCPINRIGKNPTQCCPFKVIESYPKKHIDKYFFKIDLPKKPVQFKQIE